MSRRVSFPTSIYHPILKPCKVSRTPPSDKKTKSDHQPKRKLRSGLCTSDGARTDGRIIPREKLACCRARSVIVRKHLFGNGRLNRARFLVGKLRLHPAPGAAIFRKPASPLR